MAPLAGGSVYPSSSATIDTTGDVDIFPSAKTLQPRAFQYEMLDESLRRNIIVAVRATSCSPLTS